MKYGFLVLTIATIGMTNSAFAGGEPTELVDEVLRAAGGKEVLLNLFRMKERLAVTSNPNALGSERISVVEAPKHWWLGKKDRGQEPAKYLVWAWTLGALVDAKSKIEVIPAINEADRPVNGLRVSGTINPPMEIYFDQKTHRLVRIDWQQNIHRFSEWKKYDGFWYPSKCTGHKKSTGKMWYFTEILELERLKELPDGLNR